MKLTTAAFRRLLLAAACVIGAAPASAATIVLNDIGGVTGSRAQFGFTAAARYWESVLANNVTINLDVGFSSLGRNVNGQVILGSTGSRAYSVLTSDVYDLLKEGISSRLDVDAVANLSPLSDAGGVAMLTPGYVNAATKIGIDLSQTVLDDDDTANNLRIVGTSANLKALGYNLPTGADGTVRFSSDVDFDFDPTNGIGSTASDFIGVAIHEMGHALGFVSGVDTYDFYGCPAGAGCATGAINATNVNANGSPIGRIMDLFRYSEPGTLDWRPGQEAYFSIDGGVTELLASSNESTGAYNGDKAQASHWKANGTCTGFIGIMNPYLCSGAVAAVTAQDLGAFDAIGWRLGVDVLANPNYRFTSAQAFAAAVPEPASWVMMIAGFGLTAGTLRRRRAAQRLA